MAEMVCSAVGQEAFSRSLSGLKDRYERTSSAVEHMERMEMAHIKLEAALDASDRWAVTSVPLLRWRAKLKRAAQECGTTLRRRKQRLREDEDTARTSSFPRRMAHGAKSFLWSLFTRGDDDDNDDVRRFEWFAGSASEFMRFLELGGAPRLDHFFDSLVRHLLAGKGIEHSFVHGGQHVLFLLHPFHTPEHGVEGRLMLIQTDGDAPENNFVLGLYLRLYESTDVVGVAVRCLQLFMPHHLRSIAEAVETKLTQLPTQDFSWVPNAASSSGMEHWNSLHAIVCQWFRPNPSCCQAGQDPHQSSSESFLPCGTYLEPVTKVCLQGHLPLSSPAIYREASNPTRDSQYLMKFNVLFSPHASSKYLGSATEMINGDAAERGLYAHITFEQVGEIMLPKAVERLRQIDGATVYQMLWRSRHGGTYLRVEKIAPRARATTQKDGAANRLKRRGNKLEIWRGGITTLLGSLVAHAPVQLQGLIVGWIQKEKEMQAALK